MYLLYYDKFQPVVQNRVVVINCLSPVHVSYPLALLVYPVRVFVVVIDKDVETSRNDSRGRT